MITPDDVRAAEYIIDSSGAVDLLLAGRQRDRRGRKTNPNHLRLYLIGGFLTVQHHGNFVIRSVYKTLTEDLSREDKERLGIQRRTTRADGTTETELLLDIESLNRVTKMLRTFLDYGQGSAPDLPDEERERRRHVVNDVQDAVMDVFDLGFTSTTYAMDATGVWSWGKGGHRHHQPAADDQADESAREGAKAANAA